MLFSSKIVNENHNEISRCTHQRAKVKRQTIQNAGEDGKELKTVDKVSKMSNKYLTYDSTIPILSN